MHTIAMLKCLRSHGGPLIHSFHASSMNDEDFERVFFHQMCTVIHTRVVCTHSVRLCPYAPPHTLRRSGICTSQPANCPRCIMRIKAHACQVSGMLRGVLLFVARECCGGTLGRLLVGQKPYCIQFIADVVVAQLLPCMGTCSCYGRGPMCVGSTLLLARSRYMFRTRIRSSVRRMSWPGFLEQCISLYKIGSL